MNTKENAKLSKLEDHQAIVRRMEDEDADAFCHLFDQPMSKERSLQMIHILKGQQLTKTFLTIADAEDRAAGILELHALSEEQTEIGYRIMPAYRHQGYASQAVKDIVQILFASGKTKISAYIDAENQYSEKVLLHAGFVQTEENNAVKTYQMEAVK
jgi:RimJ/RimL family protein N-acetyltransferase